MILDYLVDKIFFFLKKREILFRLIFFYQLLITLSYIIMKNGKTNFKKLAVHRKVLKVCLTTFQH